MHAVLNSVKNCYGHTIKVKELQELNSVVRYRVFRAVFIVYIEYKNKVTKPNSQIK